MNRAPPPAGVNHQARYTRQAAVPDGAAPACGETLPGPLADHPRTPRRGVIRVHTTCPGTAPRNPGYAYWPDGTEDPDGPGAARDA